MQHELRIINFELQKKVARIPDSALLLQKIEKHVGKIKKAENLSNQGVQELFSNRSLLGVDGSVYTCGTNFPYNITLYKALAKNTSGGSLEKSKVSTPLADSYYTGIEQYATENRLSLEAAYSRLKEESLASLEVEVAIQAVRKFAPRIILMDGGFLRYGSLVPEQWQEFRELAIRRECIPVGVIEEIGTFELKKILGSELPAGCQNSYDRELLFGLFLPGEWLQVYDHLVLKRGYYTCFGRLALNPQAAAWDFLEEHKGYAERVINYLYTITPRQSRGIPLWIDVVDSDVRITKNMAELVLSSALDPELNELYFKSAREKRDY